MDKLYSHVANSPAMAIFCGLAILVVLVQAAVFFRVAWKQALEMGLSKADLVKVVKSSAVFSIVPSLPIIISYMILLPALGKFFPWLRLSVIGSATYETLAANMAVTSFGFDSLGSADFSPDVFGSLLWVVTLGVFLSSLSALLLRRFDSKMQSVTTNPNSFGKVIPNIMFLGMMATLSAPYLADVTNIPSMAAIVVSALVMIGLNAVGKRAPVLKEFAFSLSMIAGMAAACLITAIL
ncbi:MAG: DUF5058 family protein [Lawsonibacter sp.]|jgi:hypothetical protein|nr:DUF5058 family protein [Lawsonibacter sp.]